VFFFFLKTRVERISITIKSSRYRRINIILVSYDKSY